MTESGHVAEVDVTEVDANNVVVDETGVQLVGVSNEDGSFTVVDYFTQNDDGVTVNAGELPAVDLALGDSATSAAADSGSSNLPVILLGVGVVGAAAVGTTVYLRRRNSTDASA